MAHSRFARSVAIIALTTSFVSASLAAEPLTFTLRDQIERRVGSGDWATRDRREEWEPGETAIIVCDVWDLHHCLNAVRRLEQFAPRLNAVLTNYGS